MDAANRGSLLYKLASLVERDAIYLAVRMNCMLIILYVVAYKLFVNLM